MSDQNELIAQFIQVSGTDENSARFYLTSSNWSLEDALNNFLVSQSDDSPAAEATGVENQSPSSSTGSVRGEQNTGNEDFVKSNSSKPKFATLNDMSQQPASDEEGQAFYAGGSDRSGQQVLGPPKRRNFREQLTDMFRMAQEHSMPEPTAVPSTSRGSAWGQGMRLGMTDDDHTVVGTNRSAAEKKPVVVLKLWSEGFSIDDGELRHYDDPQNKEFLETVMRGEIPQELLDMGRMVNVDVEDHRHEDYKRKPSAPTFKGSGHTLGSPAPSLVETTPSTAVTKTTDTTKSEETAREVLNLNASEPTTTLQIRLADGTRLTAQFNLTHTVSDIRRFIQNARPQYENSNFVLVSSFPTRELSDESSTIETAGLKNAALMQRLK